MSETFNSKDPILWAVQLNDTIVAVVDNEIRAAKIAKAIKRRGEELHKAQRVRHVSVYDFRLNEWPEHWAGKEPV